MSPVPASRIRILNDVPPRPDGDYVLYWMTAARRATWNFALERALDWARQSLRPLVVLEALRCDYPWASDRLHAFVLQGMAENARRFAAAPVTYHAYVEPTPGAGRGLLAALAARACAVVTDDAPLFFLPRMLRASVRHVPVRFEAVDGSGLLPLSAVERTFPTAYVFRRFLQRELPPHLPALPRADALSRARLPRLPAMPRRILRRWPGAGAALLEAEPRALAKLPIDHTVAPAAIQGGTRRAEAVLRRFLRHRLPRYTERRHDPLDDVHSGLSPYLHFGHIAPHEVFAAVARQEGWTPASLGETASGKREGWWGMSAPAEAFLDQLVTWRELGIAACARDAGWDRWAGLPEWARATLDAHAGDPRPYLTTRARFETARTHDPLWNAMQRQLVRDGVLHSYLRMLWGKKVLEWSRTPQAALRLLIDLNNKYALDGRDPNSYSGILWCFGRYDRPWAPERPVFGSVRFMSSDSTARKMPLGRYLEVYGAPLSGAAAPAARSASSRSRGARRARRPRARRASPRR